MFPASSISRSPRPGAVGDDRDRVQRRLHIELTTHDEPAGHPFGLAPTSDNPLVFYLPGTDIGNVLAERLAALGHPAVEPENPYWLDLGAVTFEDPDGWGVVLVPSTYS